MSRRRRSGAFEAHGGRGGSHDGGGELRWLLTYADMITLLLAFFIMLYSMSILNIGKFNQLALSVRSGFGGPLEGAGASLTYGGMANKVEIAPLQVAVENLAVLVDRQVHDLHLERAVSVRRERNAVVISLYADALRFPVGQATLSEACRRALHRIGRVLAAQPASIRVEGHTCNIPIQTALFLSNWELSAARAGAVARYLVEQVGIAPSRVIAVAYGDTRPRYPNDSETHRRLNRRVDLVVVPRIGPPDLHWDLTEVRRAFDAAGQSRGQADGEETTDETESPW
ncbi:MAG: flagellar motor protein MotB [Armatimonadetes bacterium]|nr:flagellar motor protein MotB [Armatimonadota bacterium]